MTSLPRQGILYGPGNDKEGDVSTGLLNTDSRPRPPHFAPSASRCRQSAVRRDETPPGPSEQQVITVPAICHRPSRPAPSGQTTCRCSPKRNYPRGTGSIFRAAPLRLRQPPLSAGVRDTRRVMEDGGSPPPSPSAWEAEARPGAPGEERPSGGDLNLQPGDSSGPARLRGGLRVMDHVIRSRAAFS